MTTNDNLRGLLAEAKELLGLPLGKQTDEFMARIDAALAEPVSGAAVVFPDPCEIMQMAFEEGQPMEDASGYHFELEEFDLFIERFMAEVKALNGGAVAGQRPTHTQWWLVELDRHGNPELKDGGHDDQAGANKAFYLYGELGFTGGEKYAVAKIEMFDPVADGSTVNHEALGVLQGAMKICDCRQGRDACTCKGGE